jgi:hypothetical protein
MISTTVGNIIGGVFVSLTDYYTRMMYVLLPIASDGVGSMTAWTVDTSTGNWTNHQVLFALCIGLGIQQSMVAAQASLPLADTAIGTSLMMFGRTFGGSLFVSVAGNVFTNKLMKGLATISDLGMTPKATVNAGATALERLFGSNLPLLARVKFEYDAAVILTFRTALITTCLCVSGVVVVERRSVKGRKIEMVAAWFGIWIEDEYGNLF